MLSKISCHCFISLALYFSLGFKKSRVQRILTTRDVYFEYYEIAKYGAREAYVFADVISFQPRTVIDLATSPMILLSARVLTASSDLQLEFANVGVHMSLIIIYGATKDHNITYSYSEQEITHTGVLDWSPQPKDNKVCVGVMISFAKSSAGPTKPEIKYLENYSDIADVGQLMGSLNTQLRIASALFWTRPSISMTLASYIAMATSKIKYDQAFCYTNLQAVSLGRQLAAQQGGN